MSSLALAFFIVAAILFALDSLFWWWPPAGWSSGKLQSLGLLFLTVGFITGAGLPK